MIPRGALDQLKGDERKMVDESMHAGKAALIESKIKQIKKILMEKDVTFGVAKAVIHAVEAEILEAGDVFLNKEAIINVIGNLEGQSNNADCPRPAKRNISPHRFISEDSYGKHINSLASEPCDFN